MTPSACKKVWTAEAFEDGRLEEKDRASFERHVETCEECALAVARVRELGTVLAALPAQVPTELERRRARVELLARANETMVGGDRRPRRWAFLALVPLMAAVVFVLSVVAHHRVATPATATSIAAPIFEVADLDHADFKVEHVDAMSRVVLRSGTASFHVEHVKPGARFLVALPDGEVEVRGTRFVVEVAGGHTRSVTVSEGFVAVRVGAFTGILRAGERWPAIDIAANAPAAPAAPVSPASSSSVSAPATVHHAPLPLGAGPRFGAAMSAFNAGDYGEADRLFVDFVRDFPSDTRTEDAMFLVADARARRGDPQGARDAARDYLGRFPGGLRAPAASRLAGDSAPSP